MRRALTALVVGGLAAGCGAHVPAPATFGTPTPPGRPAPAARAPAANLTAQRTHEYPAAPAARAPAAPAAHVPAAPAAHVPATPATVVGGWRSPRQAVEVFAETYTNWTAATISARLSALAEVSVGQARAAVSLAAAEAGRDYELHRAGIGNQGIVEAIAPLARTGNRYVVVTREQTSAARDGAYAGLQPTWHVAIATVSRLPGGLWVLSGWQPES